MVRKMRIDLSLYVLTAITNLAAVIYSIRTDYITVWLGLSVILVVVCLIRIRQTLRRMSEKPPPQVYDRRDLW